MEYMMAFLVNFNVNLIEIVFKVNRYDQIIDLFGYQRDSIYYLRVDFEVNFLGINLVCYLLWIIE